MSFRRSCHPASWPLTAVLALAVFSASAHDPYEITATAYLHSNRLDLEVSMEFRTGMRLAGVEPRPPAGVSTASWFAENQPALLACGKTFCAIESGTNRLPLRSVDVALGVEDHIEIHVVYPPAMSRALRFDVAGLKTLAGKGQYGVALTVLDMVNRRVLGQPVLFADAPALVAEIAVPAKTEPDSAGAPAITNAAHNVVSQPGSPSSPAAAEKTGGKLLVSALVSGAAALLLLAIVWRRSQRKS